MLLNWGVQQAREQGRDCSATPVGLSLYEAAGSETTRAVDIFGSRHVSMTLCRLGNCAFSSGA